MSQTLNVKNYSSLNILGRTELNGDVAAGVNALTVYNTTDFTAGAILVGDPGSLYAEQVVITAPAVGTAISLTGTTKFPHNSGEPVYMLFGDKIKVYSAPDQYGTGQQPDDNTFTAITGSPFAIDGGKDNTSVTDSAGAAGTWYKYTYYNSVTFQESYLSDSTAAQSGKVHYVSLDDIRSAAGLNDSPNVTDGLIAKHRARAEQEVIGALLPVYQFPLPQPTNPLVEAVTQEIAAGTLMHEVYMPVSPQMAAEGQSKADAARNGGGHITSLAELANRDVVLTDANYNEETIDEVHGVGGYPDATAIDAESRTAGAYFDVDTDY